MKVRRLAIASVAVAVAMAAFGFYAAGQAPPGTELPVHWNAAGEVDRTLPALQALLFPAGTVLGLSLLFSLIPRIEPLQDRLDGSADVLRTAWTGLLAIMVLIDAAIAAPVFGVKLPMALALFGVGLLFIVIGNALPKSRPGFFVGIRTPWSIIDTDNWIATHRLGGKLMMLSGVVITLASLLPVDAQVRTAAMFTALAVAIVPPLLYSWWLWHRKMKANV